MEALTGQEVVSQIAKKLRSRFSETDFVALYKDTPVQNMKTPCIFIHSVETIHTPQLRNYATWDEVIDIRCHPAPKQLDVYTWARSLGPAIIDTVAKLQVQGQQVRAKSATWKVEDSVLHVIVSYAYRVLQTADEVPDMHTLEYGEHIKD